MNMKQVLMLAAAPVLCLASAVSTAQSAWPQRPVTLVVPFPPGGNVDVVARALTAELQAHFPKTTFVVENKGGAGGMVATESVKNAKPDGYTFLMGVKGALMYTPLVVNRPIYDWRTDFTLVGPISRTPQILLVNPDVLPTRTVAAFVERVGKDGKNMTMGSPGVGTTNHMASEYFQELTGAEWVTAHYRGNAPATNDLVAGIVQFNFDQVASTIGFIEQGRLVPLAVTASERLKRLPNVPTFAESGFPDMIVTTDIAVFGPAGVDAQVVKTFGDAIAKVVASPAFEQRLESVGNVPIPEKAADYYAGLQQEYVRWKALIEKRKISAQ